MNENILLLSDFVGLGDVALASTRAILTHDGFRVFSLPTALISHTWNLGAPAVLDTTEYIQKSLTRWAEMGIRFRAVCIGYLANVKQAELLSRLCPIWQEQGSVILLDPVFADGGKLYSGISMEQVTLLRSLLPLVDHILPNPTEAEFLAGKAGETLERLLDALPSKTVLITGASLADSPAVALKAENQVCFLPYSPIPGSFTGTGDAFFGCYTSAILRGLSPKDAAMEAMERVSSMLRNAARDGWNFTGLPVERYWK